MNRVSIAVCIGFVILLGGCGAPVKTLRSLHGVLWDSTNQAAVAGSRVFAVSVKTHKPYLTTTDKNGSYYFKKLPAGRYVIGFMSPRHRQAEGVFVEVLDCCAVTLDYQMGTASPPEDVHHILSQITPEVLEVDSLFADP